MTLQDSIANPITDQTFLSIAIGDGPAREVGSYVSERARPTLKCPNWGTPNTELRSKP